MNFEVIGKIVDIERIAVGGGIRPLPVLRKRFGRGRWRKLKGIAQVRLYDGTLRLAEIHWFEAQGIGKRLMRIKVTLIERYGEASELNTAVCYLRPDR